MRIRLCDENIRHGLTKEGNNRLNMGRLNSYMGPDEMTSQQCLGWLDVEGKRLSLMYIFAHTEHYVIVIVAGYVLVCLEVQRAYL